MGEAGIRYRQNRLTRRWHVTIVAANGEKLHHSETLNSLDAVHGRIDRPD